MRRETIMLLLCIYPIGGICQKQVREQLHPAVLAITEKITTISEDEELPDGSSYEELIEHFTSLINRPLNINRAGERELERLKILTEWEISSLLNYRKSSGDLYSLAELYLIPGLSQESVALLIPFLTTGSAKFVLREALPGRAQILLRGTVVPQKKAGYLPITKEEYEKNPDSRYLGNPLSIYGQIRYNLQDRFSAHITVEKDAGERGADFISWSVAAKDLKIAEKIVLGSYTARFGQGLVLWNAFTLSGNREPWYSMKRENGIREFTSADENIAFKGAAATFSGKYFSATVMLSARRVDARVTDEGYTSLLTTGLHNTKTLLERKRSLGTGMAALNAGYYGRRLKLSLTVCADSRSLPYAGRNSALINRELYKARFISNAGVEWRYSPGKLLFYGEAALDRSGSPGIISGIICRLTENSQLSIKVEKVHANYIAPFSYNYSTAGSGEFATEAAFKVKSGKNHTLYLNCDYTNDRFRVSAISDYNNKRGFNSTLRGSMSPANYYIRGDLKLNAGAHLLNHFRVDYICSLNGEKMGGFHIHNEAIFKLFGNKLNFSARCAWFNVPDWELRMYSYEREVLYQFRTTLLYGKALRYYLNLHLKPAEFIDIWVKYSSTRYFDRAKTGEGPEEISGPSKGEARVQLQITL
ncbi:MAG: ComEA family DNA-binding protein [Bacteroidales bacterium]